MSIRKLQLRVRSGEDGMSVVEVMVAMVVLLIGVLGVMSMLDTANAVTSENLARDGGTGLAREQLERARALPYSTLASASSIANQLVLADSDADAPIVATFTARRRGITYTTTVTSCVLDDPADGIGIVKGEPCEPLGGSDDGDGTVPVNKPGDSLLGFNVLGIDVTGTGQAVDVVCALMGESSVIDTLIGRNGPLSPLVSTGADVGLCDNGSQLAVDRQAADATAVTSTVTWSSPRPGTVVQRAVVSGPRVAAP